MSLFLRTLAALCLLMGSVADAQPRPVLTGADQLERAVALAPADLDPEALERAVAAVRHEARRGAFPGAALAVGRYGDTALERGVGQVTWSEGPVDPAHTRYDLASLTKVVATTTAVMLLVDDGRIALDAPVAEYVPEFTAGDATGAKARVTVRHLLTHTAGLPAGGRGSSLFHFLSTRLLRRPGERAQYSDLSMVVLWAAAERAAGEPLPALLERRVWAPLGMTATGFRPGAGCPACAPTGRGPLWRGVVHDPIARRLGGVAGNAGLFSTAHDLGRFAAMLTSGGLAPGTTARVLREETVRLFTRRQPGSGSRALGWDTRGGAVTHTGYTGTSLWIDPVRGTWAVLLTNRTYQPRTPRAQRLVIALRRTLSRWVERAAHA